MIDIAFYNARFGELDDKLIDFFSGRNGFSHCEIVVNSHKMIGSHYKAKGVQEFHYANDVYADPRWTVLRIDGDRKKIIDWAYRMIGTPYDALGAVLFFLRLNALASARGVWCSEFCAAGLCLNKHEYENPFVMPNALYRRMVSQGAKTIASTNAKRGRLKGDTYGRKTSD